MTSLDTADIQRLVRRSLLLLAFGVALIVLPQVTHDPALGAVIPWFIVLVALQLGPLIWERDADLFAPPVVLGIIAFLSHAATLASFMVNDELKLDFVSVGRSDEIVALAEKALLASILGTICYFVGYYSPIGVGLRRLFPRVRGLVWNRGRIVTICVLCSLVFVVTYGIFQSRLGLPLLELTQLGAGKRVWREDVTLSWLMRGVEIGFLPVLLLLSMALSGQRGLRSLLVPGAFLLVVALLVSRLGQRGTIAYIVISALVLFHYHRWRIRNWLFIAVYFLGMALGNIMLEWRLAEDDEKRTIALIEEASDPAMVLASHEAERQRFSSLALIMDEFPKTYPYLMGESWASIVVAPIPRWLWPQKREYFDWQDDRIIFQMTGAPTPAPFVGVLYANLSWMGIVLGMILYGAFHRGLYEWLRMPGRDHNVILLYAMFLTFTGPSMAHVSTTMQYVIPIYLIIRFAGRRTA